MVGFSVNVVAGNLVPTYKFHTFLVKKLLQAVNCVKLHVGIGFQSVVFHELFDSFVL